ncbi:Zinc finger and SCAN domain-containing protein 20 [Chelonia mydas]|uniref:Zinc finger and SCAN domain-containing protein 20 n=1 Tax=Chelonia mydas TaxID=8469 RepID=M7B2R1_CHEMY|nr:Zinc finger and SCAN domain-containing protein 20 [Chelonia mydas]
MPAPHTRRSPAWSNAELLDPISICGKEAVQSQLRSSHQNYDTYRQISRCMTERGHDRDTLQCRVKVKELQNAYHKAQEANHRSSAMPMSCWFCKELDVILGGDPTSTVKVPVDTSVAHLPVENGPSQEEEILDEDVAGERDREAEDDSEVRDTCRQELISTPEKAGQSQLSELGKVKTGEEAPAAEEEEMLCGVAAQSAQLRIPLQV